MNIVKQCKCECKNECNPYVINVDAEIVFNTKLIKQHLFESLNCHEKFFELALQRKLRKVQRMSRPISNSR